MKFRVSFKTPDAVQYAIAGQLIHAIPPESTGENEGVWDARQELKERLQAVTDKFVSHGECVTIEFDSETGTATVVEKGK